MDPAESVALSDINPAGIRLDQEENGMPGTYQAPTEKDQLQRTLRAMAVCAEVAGVDPRSEHAQLVAEYVANNTKPGSRVLALRATRVAQDQMGELRIAADRMHGPQRVAAEIELRRQDILFATMTADLDQMALWENFDMARRPAGDAVALGVTLQALPAGVPLPLFLRDERRPTDAPYSSAWHAALKTATIEADYYLTGRLTQVMGMGLYPPARPGYDLPGDDDEETV